MDDDKILARGGDEHDIESFAKQNGADLTFADVLKDEMLKQNKRGTSYPIFIVVRDEKVYGVASDWQEDKERKDTDNIDTDNDLCEACKAQYDETGELPDECDEYECEESFIGYRIEKDVFQDRAAFFFTAEACNAHIEANRHHYGKDAHSYAISAYANPELKQVMAHLVGEDGIKSLQ